MQQQQHASSCSAGRRSGGAHNRNPHSGQYANATAAPWKSYSYTYSALALGDLAEEEAEALGFLPDLDTTIRQYWYKESLSA